MQLAAEVDDHALLELGVHAGADVEEHFPNEEGSDGEATGAPDEVGLFGRDDFVDEALDDAWEDEDQKRACDG
jgi:hypothetical protein